MIPHRLTSIRHLMIIPISVGAIGFSFLGIAKGCPPHLETKGNYSPTSATVAAAPVADPTVTIEAFQFTPAEITIKAGTSVTFINKDSTPHTITPDTGTPFMGTGRLAGSESKTVVFNTVGVQAYHCEIHPSMMGKITVVP